MLKNILVGLICLFVFTEGLLFFHDSKYEKNEYSNICHGLYTEKVWIDTCYLPYMQEATTYTIARNVEIGGIIVTILGILFSQKKSLLQA